jgi:oligogalacturonide lyase
MLAGIPGCLLVSVRPNLNKPVNQLPRAGEFFRFLDPVTETPVVRLTNPTAHSVLPAPTNRFISVRDRFLLFSSDRNGSFAPFQLNLRTAVLIQIGKPQNLGTESLCLNRKGSAAFLLDGDRLTEVILSNRRSRVIADGISSFSELDASSGPEPKFVGVRQGQLVIIGSSDQPPLAESVDDFCVARPGGAGCLFRRTLGPDQRQFWYAPISADRNNSAPVLLSEGAITNPVWTHDGQQLLFLRESVRNDTVVSEIRGVNPESKTEQVVARTSQFAAFSPNVDTSVFVGASRSKAQPTILLLLASPPRELTLCEHRARVASAVSPVFSPDSKRVYFQSDHEGKTALYSVNVEKLVEPTDNAE